MRKWLVLLLMWWSAAGAQPAATAKSVLMIDADTNAVLYEKNRTDVRPIASITKLMNALVVLDHHQPLEEQITITAEDIEATRLRGSQTGTTLAAGVVLTRAEMLHLALMNSQNRAAAALARTFPGGVEAFVAEMNSKAKTLGMSATVFTDPTGLHNTNVSTAEDLAKLVGAASEYQLIRDFSTSPSFSATLYTRNKAKLVPYRTTNTLTTTPNWNLIVQKTGYIAAAGRCMVVMATVGSRRVVIVLLDTPSNTARISDAINLRYWLEHGSLPPTPPKKLTRKRVS